jgi:steroid delta-isomerase-like uncharacterized protein
MSLAENKAVVQHLVDEGWNKKRLDVFDAVLAPAFINHDPNSPAVTDRNSLMQFAQAIWSAFPDFNVRVTDQVAEGDLVAKMWLAEGTQSGAFMGIPATGKRVAFGGTTVYQLADLKIARISWSYDMLGMLQQLGVVPSLAPAPA